MEDKDIKALNEEIDSLLEREYEITSVINRETKVTVDGYKLEIGESYYYQGMSNIREKLVFDTNTRFCDEVVWLMDESGVSVGYYYSNLFKEQYPKSTILGL